MDNRQGQNFLITKKKTRGDDFMRELEQRKKVLALYPYKKDNVNVS